MYNVISLSGSERILDRYRNKRVKDTIAVAISICTIRFASSPQWFSVNRYKFCNHRITEAYATIQYICHRPCMC